MQIFSIKTKIFNPPKDDIYELLDNSLESLKDGDILFITSKILAIHQGKCISFDEVKHKDELIKQEADSYIDRHKSPFGFAILTIKDNCLIPSAGIDESNANGYFICLPDNPSTEAKKICNYLKKKHNLDRLAVIITDSKTNPLRLGTVGFSIGLYGMNVCKDYVGTLDIFGRELQVAKINLPDSLSAIATLVMGEGKETTPLAIARGVEVEFTEQNTYHEIIVEKEKDIYYPILQEFKKI